MGATYCNIDLVLKARFNLTPLYEELVAAGLDELNEPRVKGGVWSATVEPRLFFSTPERALHRFLLVIESLGEERRRDWDRCLLREFDVGFVGSIERFESHWKVGQTLLREVVEVGGSLAITIYRNSPSDNVVEDAKDVE